jgi:hypothetical protein
MILTRLNSQIGAQRCGPNQNIAATSEHLSKEKSRQNSESNWHPSCGQTKVTPPGV